MSTSISDNSTHKPTDSKNRGLTSVRQTFFRVITLCTLACFSAAGLQTAHAAGSGGGSAGGGFPSQGASKPKSPEQIASSSYRSGVRHKEKAWKLEAKAAKAKKDKKRKSLLAKAKKEYTKAKEKQATVLQIQPRNHEAANELGYALRKLGDYQKAIGAYNYALELEPGFLPAIEYRGEAYLALGFLNETKAAYMRLFREDEALAAQLMEAIVAWLDAQDDTKDEVQDLARWASERQRLVSFSGQPQSTQQWQH